MLGVIFKRKQIDAQLLAAKSISAMQMNFRGECSHISNEEQTRAQKCTKMTVFYPQIAKNVHSPRNDCDLFG